MMVEGNRNVREFCQRELEKEGYQVVPSASPRDALAALRWWTPALVVLGGRMPGRSSLEVLGQIHQLHPGLPVILYTERADYARDPRVREARAVVAKTEDLAELKNTIARLLSPGIGTTSGNPPPSPN
jgi:two-component system, response regulator FlrC